MVWRERIFVDALPPASRFGGEAARAGAELVDEGAQMKSQRDSARR